MTKQGIYEIHQFKAKWDFDAGRGEQFGRSQCGPLNRLFLSREMVGRTLNVCSGTDRSGHVRVDVAMTMRPDILADVHFLPFTSKAFDTVICDPPFKMFSRLRWLTELRRLAKRKVIVCTPNVLIRLGHGWTRKIWCIDAHSMFMRIWQSFTHDILEV
jgi:hypothetical protein